MANFTRQIIYKLYNESGTYLGVLDDVISEFSITKEINGGDSEFKFSLSRKFDDFDENTTIKFNNRVKVFLKDDYNLLGDKLIAYGYIVAYSPFLRGKEEGVEVTCLSAVSKLSNDFYRTGNSLDASELGIEVTSKRVDEMMEDIITHYRTVETNSMLSNDFSNANSTTDNVGALLALNHRFFNMKHLDALREASKFLPKNKTGGYWFYWRIDTDGKLWVKNLSTTADHSFKIGKHINEISGDKSIVDVVNRVHFWNEKGTSDPHYLKIINNDSTSQSAYDVMAEYLTDSKITYLAAANLLTASRLNDGKDPKVAIKLTLTGDYDLSSIKPGQTCKILNAKNNPYTVGADNILLIESIDYSVDSAVLSLSNGHIDFSDMIEEERQRLDKEMTWYGFITQSLTAAQLGPANRTWTTDIVFSATSGADAYQKVDWTAGTINLPPISGTVSKRVVAAGTTGILTLGLDYYIYLNEETFNTSASNSDSGTGVIIQRGEILYDASKAWTTDQYQGYIATIGGETHMIRSNTATVLTIEGQWLIADTTAAYTIKKMYFDVNSNKNIIVSLTNIVFSNVKASAATNSEASILPMGTQSSMNTDGSQIANRSITKENLVLGTLTADEIAAGTITADRLSTSLLYAGTITLDTNGQIKGGMTSYDSGSGFFLGMSGSIYKFAVGNSAGSKMTWDGTTLSITGAISGTSTISIGTGNSIFKADSNGIYLGNATFASAPFRVTMAGALTATSVTLENAAVGTGSSYTGNAIAAAYIGNLTTAKITSGTITVGGASQPSNLIIVESTAGSAGATTSLLRWESTGGTLRGKIWADNSGYYGYNAIGGRHYFYTNNNENVVILDGSQTVFNEGVSCRGAFNVGVPNLTTEVGRFTNYLYFDPTSATDQYIIGGSNNLNLNAATYLYLKIGDTSALRLSSTGALFSDTSQVYMNWLLGTGTAPQIGTSGVRWYLYGSTVRYTTLTNDSDRKLKKNINPLQYGLSEINALSPVSYEYKQNDVGTHLGFIAQDVESILPELVSDDEGMKCLSTTEIIPVLVKAIQELTIRLDILETK